MGRGWLRMIWGQHQYPKRFSGLILSLASGLLRAKPSHGWSAHPSVSASPLTRTDAPLLTSQNQAWLVSGMCAINRSWIKVLKKNWTLQKHGLGLVEIEFELHIITSSTRVSWGQKFQKGKYLECQRNNLPIELFRTTTAKNHHHLHHHLLQAF